MSPSRLSARFVVPEPMFTFTTSTSRPTKHVRCNHCGWEAKGTGYLNEHEVNTLKSLMEGHRVRPAPTGEQS